MSAPGASTTPSDLAHRVRAATARARRALGDPRAAVNVRWLRALSGASNERILEVLGEVDSLVPVEEEIHRRHVAGGRANYAQFSAPLELYALVRLLQPRHVIETGVSSGLSSAHFLLAPRRTARGRSTPSTSRPRRGARFSRRTSLPSRSRRGSRADGPSRSAPPDGTSASATPRLCSRRSSVSSRASTCSCTTTCTPPNGSPSSCRSSVRSSPPGLRCWPTIPSGRGTRSTASQASCTPRWPRRGSSDLVGLRMPAPRGRRPATDRVPPPS